MIREFLNEVKEAIDGINERDVQKIIEHLLITRTHDGRVFLVGSGGGAGNASHTCADLRKLCNIESYAVYDNVSELTARTNDDGYDATIVEYLKTSKYGFHDTLFVFSVGGGTDTVSVNLTNAIRYAKSKDGFVVGIVGKKECAVTKYADAYVVIDSLELTPITEGLQMVIAHLIVTNLAINKTVW